MPIEISDLLVALLPRLLRYARVLTRSAEMADDLVQSACERGLAAGQGPGEGVPFDAWMFRITRNLWIDQKRRGNVEVLADDPDDPIELEGDISNSAPSAADVAGNRMLLERVRQSLDQLPAEQREVLLLVGVEEMSYRDAAELLGVPIGTVMSRLARGRGRLALLSGVAKEISAGAE